MNKYKKISLYNNDKFRKFPKGSFCIPLKKLNFLEYLFLKDEIIKYHQNKTIIEDDLFTKIY